MCDRTSTKPGRARNPQHKPEKQRKRKENNAKYKIAANKSGTQSQSAGKKTGLSATGGRRSENPGKQSTFGDKHEMKKRKRFGRLIRRRGEGPGGENLA